MTAYCLMTILSTGVFAQPLPRVAPEAAGFSTEGLARIDRFFAREIAANRVPGAVVAATPGTKGDFTWNGANGTQFWADPQERLVVVVGTAAPGEIRKYYREQMGTLVYGSMTELRRQR